MDYEWFNHTGDMGFRAIGESRTALFEAAGRALFDLVAGLESVRARRSVEIEIRDAVDPEDLLVRFLSELLYLHETADWLLCEFRVTELTDTSLRSEARGEPFDPRRHRILRQVKAVTYHGLRIEHVTNGWEARVVLDL